MVHMKLGEVSPGGVGVGLMGMLIYALLAVFIAGLMVGRTPEYLGKKIQAAEMKLVVLYIIAMPLALAGVRRGVGACSTSARRRSSTPAPHGLREMLYNFASAAQQQRLGVRRPGRPAPTGTRSRMGLAMLIGRFFLIIPALAIGGSLVAQAEGAGHRRHVPDRHAAVRRPRRRRRS